jgi:hypothetical protein
MSELETLARHAEEMSAKECVGRHAELPGGEVMCRCTGVTNGFVHEPHFWHPWRDWCPGLCESGCMPESERALWVQIATETRAYLDRDDDEQEALL